jgi:hypothetical protein
VGEFGGVWHLARIVHRKHYIEYSLNDLKGRNQLGDTNLLKDSAQRQLRETGDVSVDWIHIGVKRV